MNQNIKQSFDFKTDLIKQHLKYLYERNTATMLKIQAIEFLYPYRNEEMILEKLEYFYDKERDVYIKELLRKAIKGNLDSYIVTRFDKNDQELSEEEHELNPKSLSSQEIAMLRLTSN